MFKWLFTLGIVTLSSAIIACEVSDDTGTRLHLTSPAKRLVVLAPDLVENVFAIGAGGSIVGVIKGSDYPAAARQLPIVGAYSGVDLERIASLHPDLIITWKYAFPRQIAALRQLGLPVFVAAPRQLQDVSALLRKLGCMLGREPAAERTATQFEADLTQLKKTANHARIQTVFFQIDQHALMTINQDSWINQVIALCGGKNLFADAKTITPEINREALIHANPDVIMNSSTDNSWKREWQSWKMVAAVKNHRLYTIHPDLISRADTRLILGAREVCQALT